MRQTGNETYRNDTEALQELYKAIATGLEFNANMRLGRPLGTFDRPRPNRAEMRRSGQSLSNVETSLASIGALTSILAGGDGDAWVTLADALAQDYAVIQSDIDTLAAQEGGADFSLVSDLGQRIKVEALQGRIVELRQDLSVTMGPELGVIEGFNSLDGD